MMVKTLTKPAVEVLIRNPYGQIVPVPEQWVEEYLSQGCVVVKTMNTAELRYLGDPRTVVGDNVILDLKGKYSGEVLLVGNGPSGKGWEAYSKDKPIAVVNRVLEAIPTCDFFICMEADGYKLPWFNIHSEGLRIIHQQNIRYAPNLPQMDKIYGCVRSWHLAGFDPLEYIGKKPIPESLWESSDNWYKRYKTFWGVAVADRYEFGFLKGPVSIVDGVKISVGTVLLNSLHLLSFMGFKKIHLVGFDLWFKDDTQHWLGGKPYYKGCSKWFPDKQFIKINGVDTLWFLAMSAAYCKHIIKVLSTHGIEVINHSGGLLELPGIENLLDHIDGEPFNIEVAGGKIYDVGT